VVDRETQQPVREPAPFDGMRRSLLRRAFLLQLAGLVGAVVAACRPSRVARGPKVELPAVQHLNPDEVPLLAAVCDTILPSDDDPGAVELGVVQFIDRRLGQSGGDSSGFSDSLKHLHQWCVESQKKGFLQLSQPRRERALLAYASEGGPEAKQFVSSLIEMTVTGAFADPSYGGNRDRAGWKLVGFQVPCPTPSCP